MYFLLVQYFTIVYCMNKLQRIQKVLQVVTQFNKRLLHNHILQRDTPTIYFLEDSFYSAINISQFVKITESRCIKQVALCTSGLYNQDKFETCWERGEIMFLDLQCKLNNSQTIHKRRETIHLHRVGLLQHTLI
jgi:hypothetical protein